MSSHHPHQPGDRDGHRRPSSTRRSSRSTTPSRARASRSARWAALAPAERAAALRRFAAAVDGAIEELALLEVVNSGHPITQARWEAGHVRDVLNYYSARAGAA